jgi:hypothetical protein
MIARLLGLLMLGQFVPIRLVGETLNTRSRFLYRALKNVLVGGLFYGNIPA